MTACEEYFELHQVNVVGYSVPFKRGEDRILPPFCLKAPNGSELLVFGVCDAHGGHGGMFFVWIFITFLVETANFRLEGCKLVDYFVKCFPGIFTCMIEEVHSNNIQELIKSAIQSSINLIESAIKDQFGNLAETTEFGTTVTIGCISNGHIYLVMFLIHNCYLLSLKSAHALF
jgi:serine/threonine protein phosphatase PrpC